MDNWFRSSEPQNPEGRIFKSNMLSAANRTEVNMEFNEFSKNEANNMELLSRQATAMSSKVMKETLTKWEKELSLDQRDYSDFRDLFKVAKEDHWPKHVLDVGRDSPWETMQDNDDGSKWLYIYVSRTGTDSDRKFNVAICHLITNKSNTSRNVLIGGLREKNLLEEDNDDVYLKFDYY